MGARFLLLGVIVAGTINGYEEVGNLTSFTVPPIQPPNVPLLNKVVFHRGRTVYFVAVVEVGINELVSVRHDAP
jgi:hypothetical protein